MAFNAKDIHIPVPTTGGTFAVSLLRGGKEFVIRMYQLTPDGEKSYWKRVGDLSRRGRGFGSWEQARSRNVQYTKQIAELHNFWCFKGALNKMSLEESMTYFFNGSMRIDGCEYTGGSQANG